MLFETQSHKSSHKNSYDKLCELLFLLWFKKLCHLWLRHHRPMWQNKRMQILAENLDLVDQTGLTKEEFSVPQCFRVFLSEIQHRGTKTRRKVATDQKRLHPYSPGRADDRIFFQSLYTWHWPSHRRLVEMEVRPYP